MNLDFVKFLWITPKVTGKRPIKCRLACMLCDCYYICARGERSRAKVSATLPKQTLSIKVSNLTRRLS